jgi:hypothetical protein
MTEDYLYIAEGKTLGTAQHQDLSLARNIFKSIHAEKFGKERKVGADVGRRKLQAVQEAVRTGLMKTIKTYQRSGNESRFRRDATTVMRKAWRDVYVAGIRAGGVQGDPTSESLVKLSEADAEWLRGATKHEVKFLNRMLDAVVEENWKMPLDRRVEMYVRTLSSFYESARVIALPGTMALYWILGEAEHCPGCKFLAENSPYTKYNIPCTPRSGACPCLSNCKCRLLAVKVEGDASRRIVESARYTRDQLVEKLRKIKRGRKKVRRGRQGQGTAARSAGGRHTERGGNRPGVRRAGHPAKGTGRQGR